MVEVKDVGKLFMISESCPGTVAITWRHRSARLWHVDHRTHFVQEIFLIFFVLFFATRSFCYWVVCFQNISISGPGRFCIQSSGGIVTTCNNKFIKFYIHCFVAKKKSTNSNSDPLRSRFLGLNLDPTILKKNAYWLSKKSPPILYSKILHKLGQASLDIQYNNPVGSTFFLFTQRKNLSLHVLNIYLIHWWRVDKMRSIAGLDKSWLRRFVSSFILLGFAP